MIIVAQSILWLQLIAVTFSSLFYLRLCYRKNNPALLKIARTSYLGFAVLTSLASFFLMLFFLTHDFRFEYVAQYSSRDLPLHYLISSFWAGQEGSFLLWVFLGAWLGVILLFNLRENEPQTMAFYNLHHIFLSILLIKQSPFRTSAVVPADGFGLNMLLQDVWMVIHPPIVFLGYAAFTVPFAIAMASLWRRNYKEWIKPGLPWVAFSFVTLGAGIIIGGVWSYKVLGWGGYWGWDPVENASLLPWLTGIALLHGMILQRATGRMAKTNYWLAAISFTLILYSTFLTRSGILADFSVHSFVDLGITGWLIFFIFAFLLMSGYFIISRVREIPLPKSSQIKKLPILSREFGMIAAIILLCLSALLTGLGTSAPLITRLMEQPSKVSNQFYIHVNLPIAIFIGFSLSYVPLFKWGRNSLKQLFPKIIVGVVVAVLSVVIANAHGFPGIANLILLFFAGFTAGSNLVSLITNKWMESAAALAHLGVGLMFIGFVASTAYDKAERVALPQGESKSVLNYQIKFLESQFSEEAKGVHLYLPMEIQKDQQTIMGKPDIYVEAKGINRFHHPFIQRGWWSDLYISPEGYDEGEAESAHGEHIVIQKGETIKYLDYEISFLQFDLSGMSGTSAKSSIRVGTDLVVTYKDDKPVSLKPIYVVGERSTPESRVQLPGPEVAYLTLVGIDATQKTIELHYEGPVETADSSEKLPIVYAEVSTKPGMTVLWLGTILVILGGIVSIGKSSG